MEDKKKKKSGGLGGLAMLSPALALAKSLQSGSPQGLLKLSPLGMLMGSDKKSDKPGVESIALQTPTARMAKGGKVRGDGCCQRGKTKGAMR